MKNIGKFLTGLIAVAAVASCNIYDDGTFYKEPAYVLVQESYGDLVANLFKMAELADFFQSYQEIRTDREAAVEMGKSYFPESYFVEDELYYESAYVFDWGTVGLNEDGSYYASGSRNACFTITSSEPRHFIITGNSSETTYYGYPDATFYAEITCDDEMVTIEKCEITTSALNIRSVDRAPLKRPGIYTGKAAYLASAGGSLDFVYKDNDLSDEFRFNILEDCVTIERENQVVKCVLFDEHGILYDYVID